jgi:hypothetical protein
VTTGAQAPGARSAVRRTPQCLAAGALQLAQVAQVSVPAPIVDYEICREPQGVVVSIEQLVDEQRELLRQFHQLARATIDSVSSTGTGIDWATGGPA